MDPNLAFAVELNPKIKAEVSDGTDTFSDGTDTDSDYEPSLTLKTKKKSKKSQQRKASACLSNSQNPKIIKIEKSEVNDMGKAKLKSQKRKATDKAFDSNNAKIPKVEYSEPSTSTVLNGEFARNWKVEEVVAEAANVSEAIAKNVIRLLNQECTIPFIARYRKEMTGGSSADKLREIEAAYEQVKAVQKKVDNILKTLKKTDTDAKVITDLLSAKTMPEVELLYAPYKPGSKRTLAQRAKQLGLESSAMMLLTQSVTLAQLNLFSYIKPEVEGISSYEEVLTGIQYIIADIIAKDREILDYVRKHPQLSSVCITSCKSASATKEDKKAFVEGKQTDNYKYENYYKFKIPVKYIKPHQVLALNRGENKKVLTVKLEISEYFAKQIKGKCYSRFYSSKPYDPETSNFFNRCINDAFNRLLEPHICRQIRSELSKKAEKESVAVFSSNLKNLLLTPPVRGKTVIGIDPGFKHGCKLAVVSPSGDVLQTNVIFPHKANNNQTQASEKILQNLVSTYSVELIALGNGTACRETEVWLSCLIKNKFFYPYDIKYCIVNESGASIYSVTKEAEAELPGMDPNSRSAVSIARRLQDPLLEYVKIEPKHIGVGMYQHDVSETMLKTALDSIVVECVSFVGADLNVSSEVLLRKISGLNAAKAKKIIEWREKNGSFINRQQLLEVKGLGPKSFEQCAGFVKILPQTTISNSLSKEIDTGKKKKSNKLIKKPNPLDRTVIHPESYDVAEKILVELKADPNEIGESSLEKKVTDFLKFTSVEYLAQKYNQPVSGIQLIIDAFKQPAEYDIRAEFEVPLFKTDVLKIEDLKIGQIVTGRVTNMTHFGAFVDIGVGRDGLVHTTKMKNQKLSLNDRISVKVISVDQNKKIGLELWEKL